ncbi:MAG: hypothetical protein HC846_00410 [Blastocatellia bacterium]|nr:hypothetical protein [Blastocatellia bacterium]
MSKNPAKLEHQLGYKFQNPDLLQRALTHRSWAYEKMPTGSEAEIRGLQNESLEFVGDAVLGMAVVEYLFINTKCQRRRTNDDETPTRQHRHSGKKRSKT